MKQRLYLYLEKVTTIPRDLALFRFQTSKHLFQNLKFGKCVLKRAYSYLVKPEWMATSICYIQNQLHVIARMTRTANINGQSFWSSFSYSLGGKSIIDLFKNYKDLYPANETRLGRYNFLKVTQVLAKRGQLRTCILSYCVNLHDVGSIFSNMMDTIGSLNEIGEIERVKWYRNTWEHLTMIW